MQGELELKQRSQNFSPRENPLGRGKARSICWSRELGSRPQCGQWAEGPQGVAKNSNGLMGRIGLDPCTLSSGH